MLRRCILACLFGLELLAAALDPIEVVGNKFFNKNGSQFLVKGVAYQLLPNDPLMDTEQCRLDASLMKQLGVNAIRVYHVDAVANHDGCMEAFADAGIYVLVDLDTFSTYIVPGNLYWNASQYNEYTKVMDTFQRYDNLLGFFVGNENIASKDASPAAPFLKAAARDMKAYRDKKGYRKIPVGYSAADIKELRPTLQDYLTCGGNSSETVDFFGLNSYSWCDPSTFEQSSYNELQEYAKNFPVPIFFTETGCNVPGPRLFDDQEAIFSMPMLEDWSGAIVYEWIQEQNNYGLITYGPLKAGGPHEGQEQVQDGFARKGRPTPMVPDFDNLKSKWAKLQPTGINKAAYNAQAVSTRPCPTATPGSWWLVNGYDKLPLLGDSATLLPIPEEPQQSKPPSQGTKTTQARTSTLTPTSTASAGSTPPPSPDDANAGGQENGHDGKPEGSTDRLAPGLGATVAGAVLVVAIIV
ncbi:hypothetical protein CDD81_7684 [Ophiocordyceps australis]|uniref:1,3-beta-glucanosyltransferase n=1 Tax=Ophiocordyceps australis TaxID=1399860 RepID=A0A2C5Y2W9_9HYPO|nr:hypothetical protein CDD81_7684 [Ophiocordyceps australis]